MPFSESFLRSEVRRTQPDYLIYAPACSDDFKDHGNEHVHVFRVRDGRLCALWTMSEFEGKPSQRPMLAFSRNGGISWTSPKCLLRDPINPETGENMGSWAAAAVSKSGRIYVIYSKKTGDSSSHQQGKMAILCSDDCGDTWSEEALRDVRRTRYDLAPEQGAVDWVVWQNAYRLASGKVLMGFTRGWLSYPPAPDNLWVQHPCGCEFFRLDNIDDDPAPADLKISYWPDEEHPLSAPLRGYPDRFCAEEPAVCELPDGRLFLVMRTAEGHVWYSVSDDDGETWRPTEMLRYRDGGKGIEHPLSPSPMFRTGEKEYVLFIHNHDGYNGHALPQLDGNWRNPLFILKGEYRPDAHQPVWFSEPVEFMNNGDVSLSRKDLAMYSDMTIEDGEPVLWYPDRKFFLLGRRIPRTFLDSMHVDLK